MATSLSQEDINFLRLAGLLIRVAPRAVRQRFDFEFHPEQLQQFLRTNRGKIDNLTYKKRIITLAQYDVLYPRGSSEVSSDLFDVSLMVCLLRNFTDLDIHDTLPMKTIHTDAADISRIKFYRNSIVHHDSSKIDENEFSKVWNCVAEAIHRLLPDLKAEIDSLISSPLTNVNVMRDLIQLEKNLETTSQHMLTMNKKMATLETEKNNIKGNGSMNIALNKNATQVSTFNDNVSRFGPMNANNGKRNQVATNGDCTHTTDKDPVKWWTVDFGNMYTIESVYIIARTDCCLERHSDFEIRLHNTSDWSSQYCLCYKQVGQAPTEMNINCNDGLSGKYLTVYKKDDYHHYPLSLCEVEVYGNEVTGKTVNTNALKPTTEITTITNQIRQMTTNTRNIQPKENMNMCLCKRSASDIYQQQNHNYSKEERQFLINERIKLLQKELKIDKSKLSSTRRKKTCAEDDRRSSQHLGFIGIIVLVSIMGCIVLSDLVDLIRFINKPRCRWCMRKRKKKK